LGLLLLALLLPLLPSMSPTSEQIEKKRAEAVAVLEVFRDAVIPRATTSPIMKVARPELEARASMLILNIVLQQLLKLVRPVRSLQVFTST
jgi:hypothetical protein